MTRDRTPGPSPADTPLPHVPPFARVISAQELEQAFASANTAWEWAKIERRQAAGSTAGRKAALHRRLRQRDARKPLQVTVRYRGGPECWWEISGRGREYHIPGSVCLHDAMMWINAQRYV